jgi:adenine-specific DNA-methyltransferase
MTEAVEQPKDVELLNIHVSDIVFTDRARQNYKDLDLLGADIKEKGVIQPIAVMRIADGKFKLLAGGRRYSACVMEQIPVIPARVYPDELTELSMREIELMENISRADFDWKEKVWLTNEIDKLQKEKHGIAHGPSAGHSSSDTAKMLGVTPMTVSRDKKLARGLEEHREKLSTAKTETEALRMLRKIERQGEERTAIENMEEKLKHDRGARLKRSMTNGYILKDFFEGVKQVPDRAVSFVEIDPPYAIELDKIKRGADTKTSPGIESYNEVEAMDYPTFMQNLFVECHRVMAPGSWLVCWFGIQWYQLILEAIESAGFQCCNLPAIWTKIGHQGQTRNPDQRLGNVYEPFFYARKDSNANIRQPGRTNNFAFKALHPDKKVHPTERPIEMIEEVIKTFCPPGGHIMVPFLGSGNSLLAAGNLGSTCFGFDLSEEYKNAYIKRVLDGEPGKYRSYEI